MFSSSHKSDCYTWVAIYSRAEIPHICKLRRERFIGGRLLCFHFLRFSFSFTLSLSFYNDSPHSILNRNGRWTTQTWTLPKHCWCQSCNGHCPPPRKGNKECLSLSLRIMDILSTGFFSFSSLSLLLGSFGGSKQVQACRRLAICLWNRSKTFWWKLCKSILEEEQKFALTHSMQT